jgi:hypothetical protein
MFRRNVLFPSSATKNRPNNQYAVLIIQQSRWFHIPEDRKTCTGVAVRTSNPTNLLYIQLILSRFMGEYRPGLDW